MPHAFLTLIVKILMLRPSRCTLCDRLKSSQVADGMHRVEKCRYARPLCA